MCSKKNVEKLGEMSRVEQVERIANLPDFALSSICCSMSNIYTITSPKQMLLEMKNVITLHSQIETETKLEKKIKKSTQNINQIKIKYLTSI
jgi:hypothetical protein